MGEFKQPGAPNSAKVGETKGGGFKGGPKRWTGRGPAPARHIPWPEIFKHHISLVEGHLKMLEMVRKHTVPETGNYRTMSEFVNRAKEMLYTSKQNQRIFVPPPNHIEQVPLGSSSASMYPGYSPADHEYGKAAEEYGREAARARAEGIEFRPDGIDYEVGQGKGVKRKTLAQIRAAKAAKENKTGSGTGSGSDDGAAKSAKKSAAPQVGATHDKPTDRDSEGDNPVFFVDTNPTPVNLSGVPHRPSKRESSPPKPVEVNKAKRHKKKHDGDLPVDADTTGIELEDISAEVDARMKEKEEKRKRKEKKRKRDTEGSSALVTEEPSAAVEVEKPKKKKPKKAERGVLADEVVSKKRQGNDSGEAGNGEGKAKKKRKKTQGDAADA